MADIRIKDLTTTASTTAADDFFAADGATNGTRKLSAYSPTFGGNATVGGTLTVNGMTTSNGYKTPGGGYSLQFGTSDTNTRITGDNGASVDSYLKFYTSGALALQVDVNSQVQVKATTASTTTSTGALVVSGGLGVGGAVNIGGTLTANGTTFNLSTASANGSFINMDGLAGNFKIITTRTGGVDRWYFGQDTAAESGSNAGSPFFIRALTDAGAVIDTPLTITRAAGGRLTTPRPVTISDSTASTSTSSGALVVSGGVGVGGAIVMGGALTIDNVGADNKILLNRTGGKQWIVNVDASQFYVYNNTDAVNGLNITNAGNVTLAGSIRTSAPVGGTAASWKLGTVATVSPTSPNRTIEVDIGGTIYYIHAKTTNN
jgi:hypothetical protein